MGGSTGFGCGRRAVAAVLTNWKVKLEYTEAEASVWAMKPIQGSVPPRALRAKAHMIRPAVFVIRR